jgi:hypothetical protein
MRRVSSNAAQTALHILKKRCGTWTDAVLVDGTRVRVLDVAWGYDQGDSDPHITANVSPGPSDALDAAEPAFFFASEVLRLEDPLDGTILFQARDGDED